MQSLVVYDSQFGNTKRVAEAIGQALGEARVIHINEAQPGQLSGVDLLVVGSPTQRLNATPATTNFLKAIPADGLDGVRVAAFDTRFTVEKIQSIRVLPFFVRFFGYAAEKIARQLKAKGGVSAGDPGLFYVFDTEGPLLDGELVKAGEWTKSLNRPA